MAKGGLCNMCSGNGVNYSSRTGKIECHSCKLYWRIPHEQMADPEALSLLTPKCIAGTISYIENVSIWHFVTDTVSTAREYYSNKNN